MTLLRSGSATDVGKVRSSNQDVALEDPDLYAVADGMGGHVGGEVAARVAIDTLRASFQRQPTVEGLRRAVAEANRAVWREGQSQSGLRGMGTTLTATALVRDPGGRQVIALANVGDSRAYVFSRGQVIQITADHSLAEERVRQGEMTEAEAAVHPHRHILTRALGVSSDVDVDLWELHLTDGDRILLCSDGLTNEVGDDQIGRILASMREPSEAAASLVRAAVEHGGSDNVTVVVVDVTSTVEPAEAPDGERSEQPAGGTGSGTAPLGTAPADADGKLAGAAAVGGIAVGAAAVGDVSTGADAAGDGQDQPGTAPAAPAAAAGIPGGAGHDADVTGVVRAVGGAAAPAVMPNGRASTRAMAGGAAARSGGPGATDPASVTGVVTATRPPEDAPNGEGPGAAGAGRPPLGAAGVAGAGRASHTLAVSSGGASRAAASGAGSGTGSGAGGPGGAAGGSRANHDFGSQAAELRRLRPSRKELRRRSRMAGVPRLVTVRVVLFLILVLAVLAAGYTLVRWYAMDDWYVGVDHQHLAVYQGRPGGFLWFKPKLVDDTSVTTDEILPFHLPAVRANHQAPSLKVARRYVENLHQEYLATQPTGSGSGTSPSTATTTTTTAAST